MALFDNLKKLQEQTKPNMNEIASADVGMYGIKGDIVPYNPDTLIGRRGLYMYDQMRVDDQIKACLTLKKFATVAPSFQIIAASDDEQDIEVAEFVEYCFNKMQGSIVDNILEILTALDYGFSISEINYKTIETGQFAGKIGLKNIKTKKPHYYKFAVDEYTNLLKDGVVYQEGGEDKRYPINKFLIFSYQKEFGNHYGTSDLRPAYRGYWSKDVLIKMWNIYLERFANPTVLGKYKTNDPSARQNLRSILDNLTAKTSITHRMEEFDIQLLESGRSATDDFERALNFYNKSIARSILIPDRLMADGDTGAYAQAKIHFDVFLWVIQKLRQDIEHTVMGEQLIRRLVAYNYSNVEELPHFKFNPMTDDQKLQLNTLFIDAVQKGVINPTIEDENILRKNLNFPEKDYEPDEPETEIEETPDEEEIEEITENSYAEIDLRPNEGMKAEAEKGLKWRAEFGRGGTIIGVTRANQLKNRENLSPTTVRRMNSYFARHEVDKQAEGFSPGEKGFPSNGRIAWALWGGDAGQRWAKMKSAQLEKQDNNALTYNRDKALQNKVDKHNEEYGDTKTKRVTLGKLKIVYDRGVGAFRTNPGSVRPGVGSSEQWAMARVNSFLAALRTGRFRSGRHDTDLFPEGHPLSTKKKDKSKLNEEVVYCHGHKHYKTKAEKRVDYQKIDEQLDKAQNEFLFNTQAVMKKQMEGVKKYIENKMNQGKLDFNAVDNLEIKNKNDLINAFKDGYQFAYDLGAEQSRKELPRKLSTTKIGQGLVAKGFLRFLQSKSRLDVKRILAQVNSNITTVMLNAISTGQGVPATMLAVEEAFSPYVADGSVIKPNGTIQTPYRLEAVTRTATLGSYNYGRRSIGEDPDVKDFVVGYQLSAVLDERTSDICELVAELEPTIKAEDEATLNELTPPLHFNCRTLMVFLTKDDQPIQWSTEGDLSEIIAMASMTE